MSPDLITELYRTWVMPLTKEVQVVRQLRDCFGGLWDQSIPHFHAPVVFNAIFSAHLSRWLNRAVLCFLGGFPPFVCVFVAIRCYVGIPSRGLGLVHVCRRTFSSGSTPRSARSSASRSLLR